MTVGPVATIATGPGVRFNREALSMTSPMLPSSPELLWPDDEALLAAVHPWLVERRWFPLKGDAAPEADALTIAASVDYSPRVRDLLIAASRGDDPLAAPVLIHVPLVLEEAAALDSFTVEGESGGSHGLRMPDGPALVDGAHHPDFWRAWATRALEAGTVIGEEGVRAIIERAPDGRVMTGEQSNTNVVLAAPADSGAPDLVVKLFRVLAPGRNPDVEISAALAADGWDCVRTPVAWSTLTWADTAGQSVEADSAVACTFIPEADDGFELFCRLGSNDDGSGGAVRERARFLAHSLGTTTAQMHHHLARALGSSTPPAPDVLAKALRERARWAFDELSFLESAVPGLRASAEALYTRLEALDRLDDATRIHGDYHLGQVLHELGVPVDEAKWFVLDFEGEPLRPLAQRSMPDQPMRDVAGMLRSFDYAAAVSKAQDPSWRDAMREAFLDGYIRESGADAELQDRRDVLIGALELDKALYEAVYEARNRPTWIDIPIQGIRSILSRS